MFHVEWVPSAVNELAEIWARAGDRDAITVAVDEIDKILRSSAADAGEGRDGIKRILFVMPVAIYFDASEADRTAKVLNIWRFDRVR